MKVPAHILRVVAFACMLGIVANWLMDVTPTGPATCRQSFALIAVS